MLFKRHHKKHIINAVLLPFKNFVIFKNKIIKNSIHIKNINRNFSGGFQVLLKGGSFMDKGSVMQNERSF